jgi:hypothetical protein
LLKLRAKKEILPKKKLDQNKLRNVMAVDAGHNMWAQRLTYKQNKRINSNPIRSWSALGWTPYSRGMDQLAHHLGESGFNSGWEFDISSCDAKLFENLLLGIAHMRWRALRPQDQTQPNLTRMLNLYRMISRTPLALPDGAVFLKGLNGFGGNLTGQVGTAHDNTIFGLFLLAYSFIVLVGPDIELFKKCIRAITLGDDITFTVHDDIVEEFNGPAIAELCFKNLGVVFESPCWAARPFYELGFLSMHFKWDAEHNCYFHTVDRDKLFSSLLQGGTTRTPAEQLQRICGMRNVAWGDIQMRQDLENIYWLYLERYEIMLKGVDTWETAKKSYVSLGMLARLYAGFESCDLSFEPWLEVHATSFSAWREQV